MSERTTKAMVVASFKYFVKAIGGHVATSYNDVGGYKLDYNGVYGGYVVEQIANEGGGIRQPFGPMRRKAREMADTLRFAQDTIRLLNDPRH